MKVFHSAEEIPTPLKGGAVTLGVFDGVHLGHQMVLSRTVELASELGGAAGVITFDAHPDQLLHETKPCFLTSLEHRLLLIGNLGIECALVLEFDRALARTPARSFAEQVFRGGFAARAAVMGERSRFGRGGEGTPEKLSRWGGPWGLTVEVVPPLMIDGGPVSSTRIRRAVGSGQLDAARRLLGRPFSVLGTVVVGAGRGRKLGFPTANLDLHHEACPRRGVYVGRALLGGQWFPAAVAVGHAPTFATDGADEPLVEVYLVDFSGDIVGETLEVEFLKRLRDQQRFADPQDLTEQVARDIAVVRRFFSSEVTGKETSREDS